MIAQIYFLFESLSHENFTPYMIGENYVRNAIEVEKKEGRENFFCKTYITM